MLSLPVQATLPRRAALVPGSLSSCGATPPPEHQSTSEARAPYTECDPFGSLCETKRHALQCHSMRAIRMLSSELQGLACHQCRKSQQKYSRSTCLLRPCARDGETYTERRPDLQVRGDIEFRDVRFRHAGRTAWTLDGVSFSIAAGSTVALVGPSGSGATHGMSP